MGHGAKQVAVERGPSSQAETAAKLGKIARRGSRVGAAQPAKAAKIGVVTQLLAGAIEGTQSLDEREQMDADQLGCGQRTMAPLAARARPRVIEPAIRHDFGDDKQFWIFGFIDSDKFHR